MSHSIILLRLRQTEISGLTECHTGRRSVEHTCMTHEDANTHTHTQTKRQQLKLEDSAHLHSITTKRHLLFYWLCFKATKMKSITFNDSMEPLYRIQRVFNIEKYKISYVCDTQHIDHTDICVDQKNSGALFFFFTFFGLISWNFRKCILGFFPLLDKWDRRLIQQPVY